MTDSAEPVRRPRRRRTAAHDPARLLLKQLRRTGRLFFRRGKTPGASPGTIVHTGPRRVEKVLYETFRYNTDTFTESRPDDITGCFPLASPQLITWINVDGVHEVERLRAIGESAGLHPLVVEDVASTGQRPKVEEYDTQLFIVLRMLSYDDKHLAIDEEQLSLVLGASYLISFQEQPGDSFDPVRARLRSGKGVMRTRGADYLAYALIDAVVDHYFVVLEKLAERLEELEAEVIEAPSPTTINQVHRLKRELLVMRKAVRPLRDVLNSLIRDENELISDHTRVFLRDAYDHTIQVIDTMETMRDLVSGLMDLYLSALSNRMNEVMKVLTIIATIFIPLTFIVGVYGMNFDYMPELEWRYGYPVVLLLMAVIAGGMLVYFRRRSWL